MAHGQVRHLLNKSYIYTGNGQEGAFSRRWTFLLSNVRVVSLVAVITEAKGNDPNMRVENPTVTSMQI